MAISDRGHLQVRFSKETVLDQPQDSSQGHTTLQGACQQHQC